MYETVLVPTDGSDGSAHVALQAIDLAEQYGATVHALSVVDDDVGSLLDRGNREELTGRARRAVARVERMAEAHGVAAETAVREGDPAETILAYAEEIGADLLVAGTHGRSGVGRRLIGSVAERLVRHATCPVMTVRLPETDVTVDDPEAAEEHATAALEAADINASVSGVQRQNNVWVAETDAGHLVYVDPVTQRTSVVGR